MSDDLSPEKGEGELVYVDTMNSPQRGIHGVPGVILADLPACTAGCGRKVLKRTVYRRLSVEDQRHLQRLKVCRTEARGICGGCYMRMKKRGELPGSGVRKVNVPIQERRNDIPEIWNSVLESGGGYNELAERLEISREYARQLVVKLGLRKAEMRRRDSDEREHFLEELDRLLRFGLGVHELAQRFGLTDGELIEKVARLRERDYTQVRFDSYTSLEVAA